MTTGVEADERMLKMIGIALLVFLIVFIPFAFWVLSTEDPNSYGPKDFEQRCENVGGTVIVVGSKSKAYQCVVEVQP
jgi:hypothetical protein